MPGRKITSLDRLAEQLAKDLVSRGICSKGILDVNHHKPEDVPTQPADPGHQR